MLDDFHDAAWLEKTRAEGDVSAWLARVPYTRFIGVSASPDAEGDGMVFHLEPHAHNIGNILLPAIHGGVVAAFMETAGTLDLMLAARTPRLPRIVDFSIDYLRAARAIPTHARCSLLREGRRMANVQVTAWQEREAEPVATARLHFVLSATEQSSA
ncbi:PaaI family thioesterase [Halomonas sp. DQ26W]|uniref:PaaI family thioesterase n=1 Tax=Halomonas sp. DQ26W TaxID=2282311 RepID=UPI000DF78AEF|nr:PaaI family thioesterase [Halomonas sp. DQ26W]RDB43893.1 PaaI family thioesterase [Halomonas sp. DQ26W]